MVSAELTQRCVVAYAKHKHLKLASNDVGIPWQTVYVYLRRAGIQVTGDKLRYGSDTDRLAAIAEQHFQRLVPSAKDQNSTKFQSKVDFFVYGFGVDVKSSRLHDAGLGKSKKWAFSVKKQEAVADFFVCFAYADDSQHVVRTLLIPGEIAKHYTNISLPEWGGKWADYEVDPDSLEQFFASLKAKPDAHQKPTPIHR